MAARPFEDLILRFRTGFAFCLGLLAAAANANDPIRVIDDSGREVRLDAPAVRIVTLTPHTTELVYAAGAGSRLVGTTAFSNYPEEASLITRVGDATHLDRERLLALAPDLVLAWPSGNNPRDLAWLEDRGIPIYRSEPVELGAIADNIRDIGRLAGSDTAAETVAAHFDARLAELRLRYTRQPPVRVFYQVWPDPLFTVGNGHLISRVLELCGGLPLFPDLVPVSPTVSREAVILANPQAIVAALPERGTDDPFDRWRRWESVEAVRERRFITVHPDLVHRATPRILDGAEQICRGLHPAL